MRKIKINFKFEERIKKIEKWIEETEKNSLPKIDGEYLFCFHKSKFVRIFSILVFVVALLISLYFIIWVNSGYLKWWVPLFSLTILALGVISSPVAIHIGKKEIEIHALLEETKIRICSIEHVYSLNSTYAKLFIIPILTTFGFLGFNGRYYDIRNQRWVKLVCTEHKNLIMIECIGKKSYIISATNRAEVISQITQQVLQSKQEMEEIIEHHYGH
ncbi:MAG: hypothetical protein RR550_00525 [Rikenellaceae bacterium]